MYPALVWVGKTHLPFVKKKITAKHYREAKDCLKPGYVMLGKRHGEASNLLIPGYWPHAAIYVGANQVVEAVGEGVRITDLIDFMLSRDEVAIFKPTFAEENILKLAAEWARQQVGKPYDFRFEMNNLAFYCAEIVYDAFSMFISNLPFKRQMCMGEELYIPDNIADNVICWERIWDGDSGFKTNV